MGNRTFPFTVGLTPVLALMGNIGRIAWRVTMPSTGIISGNTGRVHIGRGFQPSTDLTSPIIGDIVTAGSETREAKTFKDDRVFNGDLWLVATVAAQVVIVEEDLDLPGSGG
jgi:hypothetical protein